MKYTVVRENSVTEISKYNILYNTHNIPTHKDFPR